MEQIRYSDIRYSVEELDKWRLAGKISAKALHYGAGLIKKGSTVLEVVESVDKKIIELGAKPSFPSQVSLDDVAAHFCPDSDDRTVLDTQVAKLDVGASVDGFLSDTAATIDLSGNNSELVKASGDALEAAIRIARPGTVLGELGRVIRETISSYGFSPIINLSGHGIGRFKVHTSPTVPNYDNGDSEELFDGQIIAIEPFATSGSGSIYESSNPTVFMEVSKKPVRDSSVRLIFAEIQGYKGLPFTKRWLSGKFPSFKVNYALKHLADIGAIQSFPPLVERRHGLVSQAEHTILVREKPEVLTRMS
ncbi:type II methionyl aminopeptidase [Candidatus Woesearchaeota archaeon]|nr:type II methionyl aminopeptidase [Candidatus Woesearchaeota archaeon]